MANLLRQQYTRPIPAGAQRIRMTVKRRSRQVEVDGVRFKEDGGKWVNAPIVEEGKQAGTHCRVPSPLWYGTVGGKKVPLCESKSASEQLLAQLRREADLDKKGIGDPFRKHRSRPLLEHLQDFEDYLRQAPLRKKKPKEKQVKLKTERIRSVLEGARLLFSCDFSLSAVQRFLAELAAGEPIDDIPDQGLFTRSELARLLGIDPRSIRTLIARAELPAIGNGKARRFPRATVIALIESSRRGHSRQTVSYYAREIKSFCKWLVEDQRMPSNPLAALKPGAISSSHRRDRRTLSQTELQQILDAAAKSHKIYRRLSGLDRWALYLTAMSTGFRVSELASLTPEHFLFDAKPPTVRLGDLQSKNDDGAYQPLPVEPAEALRSYVARQTAGKLIWSGTWVDVAAQVLRRDLVAAGIPYAVAGINGPEYADFHALRHSFVALLDEAGLTLKQAMQLARHSDPRLTMARYGRGKIAELGEAVNKIPSLLPKNPCQDT